MSIKQTVLDALSALTAQVQALPDDVNADLQAQLDAAKAAVVADDAVVAADEAKVADVSGQLDAANAKLAAVKAALGL